MTDILKKIESLVIELNKSYKALQFYPEGHPALEAANRRTIDYIKEIVDEEGQISFSITRAGFEYEGERILKDSKEYMLFSREFFSRNISKIIFLKDVQVEELISFSKVLSEDPKEIRASGGIESVMLDNNIKNIWSNEVNYEKLLERQKQVEEEEEEEEEVEEIQEFDESDFEDYVETEPEVEKEETFEEQVEAAEDEDEKNALEQLSDVFISNKELFKLLRKLYKETDKEAYSEKLNKIVNACHHLNNAKEYEVVLRVVQFLFKLMENPSSPFDSQKELLKSSIREVSVTEVISIAIDTMNKDKDRDKTKYFSLFLALGGMCIPILLGYIVERADIKSRNNVSDALSAYGEKAFDTIKPWLDDGRWQVVCGAVDAIGKVGSENGLDLIMPALEYPETQVKRQVVKALGNIRCDESREMLLSIIRSREKDLLRFAILSLGSLQDEISIPNLIKLTKKGIFIKNDMETRKAAIIALGMSGSTMAIPALLRIIKHSALFGGGKEFDKLRLLAVRAISEIGGEEAIQALEIGANTNKLIIQNECKNMLEKVVMKMREEENPDA
jgi:HEAT repeat protein